MGSLFIGQFWFQWGLIAIISLFYIIIFVFRKQSLFILRLISILYYILEYSGCVYRNYFLKYPEYEKYTIGKLFESIPYEVTGFTFGYYKALDLLAKNNIKYSNFKGTGFQGIYLNVQSVYIISIFSLLPFDKVKNKFIKILLDLLTKNTAGVNNLHISIYDYFKTILKI